MLRKPNFGTTTYFLVTEVVPKGEHPQWLTEWPCEHVEEDRMEGWMEDVKGNCDIMPEFKKEEFTVQNREYNTKHIYGRHFDNHDNFIQDEDCPKCGHLMVGLEDGHPDDESVPIGIVGKFCSNYDDECGYRDDDLIAHHAAEEAHWKAIKDSPPLPKFRELGQTLEEFCEKYHMDSERAHVKECATCKQKLDVSDFYRTKDYACIEFNKGHKDGCENGPCTFVFLGEKGEKFKNTCMGLFDALRGNTPEDDPPFNEGEQNDGPNKQL